MLCGHSVAECCLLAIVCSVAGWFGRFFVSVGFTMLATSLSSHEEANTEHSPVLVIKGLFMFSAR